MANIDLHRKNPLSSMNRKLCLEITLTLLFSLALLKPQINAAPHQKKRQSSSITVVGRVLCQTCSATQSYFIPGAQVGVECSLGRERGETDSHGMFRIELPLGFTIDKCTVHLLGSSLLSCNVPFLNYTTRLSIKSRINSHFVYRAAPLSFRPPFCKKPSRIMSSQDSLPPSKIDFPFPFPFPPIPPISLPPLFPPLPFPPIPPISFPPLFPPFGDLPPIPFWPPLPDVPINPPFGPPPPPLPISSPPSPAPA